MEFISSLYSYLMILLHNLIHDKILAWSAQSKFVNYLRKKKRTTINHQGSKSFPLSKEIPTAIEVEKQIEAYKYSIINNNICLISGCNPGPHTLQGTNTYLIGYNHCYPTNSSSDNNIVLSSNVPSPGKILIDAGECSKCEEYISLLLDIVFPLTNTKYLSHILLTHYHHDHMGMYM